MRVIVLLTVCAYSVQRLEQYGSEHLGSLLPVSSAQMSEAAAI